MTNTKKLRELDINEIFSILYKEKYKIFLILTLFFIAGLYKSISTENIYRFSIDLSQASDSSFLRYIKLNDIIEESLSQSHSSQTLPSMSAQTLKLFKDEDKHILNFYKISAKSVFEEFILKLNERSTITSSIREFYNNSDNKSDNLNEESLVLLTKKFNLTHSIHNEKSNTLVFTWPFIKETGDLAELVIFNTLLSVKKTILNDLDFIKEFINNKKNRRIRNVNQKINILAIQTRDSVNSRINFLKEQLIIAKELGIIQSQFKFGITPENHHNNIHLDINSNNHYYLNGSNFILQEIKYLENRSNEDILLLSQEYLSLIKEIKLLENDDTIELLNKFIYEFSQTNPKDWINYNLLFADISNLKDTGQTITLSILLGIFFGSALVLFSYALRNKKLKK